MVKNAVDVVLGGITYWMFGFGFSFGEDSWSNGFIGWGHFFVDSKTLTAAGDGGNLFSSFVFQVHRSQDTSLILNSLFFILLCHEKSMT